MKHDIALIEKQFLTLSKGLDKLTLKEKEIKGFLDIIHGPGYTTIAEHFMLLGIINSTIKLTEQLNIQKNLILEASVMIPNG